MTIAIKAGVAACVALLVCPAVASAQDDAPDQVRAARRTARLMSRSSLTPEARSTTAVVGSVWSPDNQAVPDVAVRLRNLVVGEITAVTRSNEAGDFALEQVPPGTYLLEVAEEEDGNPVALGDVFTIGTGETVAIFVKLPAPPGWTSALAALLGAPGGAAGAGAGAGGAAVGSTVGSAVGGTVGSVVGSAASTVASTFSSAVASVVSSAAGAGVTGIGGGRSASNEDQPR